MGILYNAAVVGNQVKNRSQEHMLSELKRLNVTVSQQGTPINRMDNAEIAYEYVLAILSEIDVENQENAWF
ncbi:hypothetical protein P4345_25850 [Cytobacillus horneckiae]|uniref:hypothetical protein n=1 Tax=Cytobacillus horneckiae TaxID=549687 RepID=UPI002E1E9BEE|nr:hypothetical protein [Cytobacillus horneckiae]